MTIDEIQILVKHNLENVLHSVSVGWIMGLDKDVMRKAIRNLKV